MVMLYSFKYSQMNSFILVRDERKVKGREGESEASDQHKQAGGANEIVSPGLSRMLMLNYEAVDLPAGVAVRSRPVTGFLLIPSARDLLTFP